MANEVSKRLGLVGSACTLTAFSALGLALFICTVTGIGLVLVSVGIPMLVVCLPLLRRLAGYHRRWAARQLGIAPIPASYAPVPDGNVLTRLWAAAKDPAMRRDLVWLLVNSTVGLAIYLVAIVESLLGLVFWWMPQRLALDTNARIARSLLVPQREDPAGQPGAAADRISRRDRRHAGRRDPPHRARPARRGPGPARRARHQPRPRRGRRGERPGERQAPARRGARGQQPGTRRDPRTGARHPPARSRRPGPGRRGAGARPGEPPSGRDRGSRSPAGCPPRSSRRPTSPSPRC